MLFRSTVPIYPTISSHPDIDKAHTCEVFKRPSFPTDFLRTNRQIHAEASAVLWGDNQIVFQFPLNWNLEYNQSRQSANGRGERRPPWFVRRETFMPSPEHLHQIRNLVIEVYLMRSSKTENTPANKPARPSTIVRKQLTAFCEAMRTGHQLHTLEIRFTNSNSTYNPNEVLEDFGPVHHHSHPENHPWTRHDRCCFSNLYAAFGRKGLNIDELEELCRQAIDVDQQVLEPLMELRGVGNVNVVGRITDDWAEFIKICMQDATGTKTEAGTFEHRTVVQWVEPPAKRKGKKRTRIE